MMSIKIVNTGYSQGTRTCTLLREKLMKIILQHHRIPVLGAALVKVVAVAVAVALGQVVAVVVDLTLAVVAPRLVTAVDALVVAVLGEGG